LMLDQRIRPLRPANHLGTNCVNTRKPGYIQKRSALFRRLRIFFPRTCLD
jgi:hypothetical protein